MIDPESFETEVRELHAFFERWYSGVAKSSEVSRLDVLADSFVMIGPDADMVGRAEVRASIVAARGRRPMQIEIRNIVVRPELDLGTYEEWQTTGGAVTGRLSTAVMRSVPGLPNGLVWVHLHETWLPDIRS